MEKTELTATESAQGEGGAISGPFTPARALDLFSPYVLDTHKVRQIVLQMLLGEVMKCPACGQPVSRRQCETLSQENGRVCCKHCNRWFTNRTGTILDRSCLTFSSFYLLAVLTALGVDLQTRAKIIGVHPDTVKNWDAKFEAVEVLRNGGEV